MLVLFLCCMMKIIEMTSGRQIQYKPKRKTQRRRGIRKVDYCKVECEEPMKLNHTLCLRSGCGLVYPCSMNTGQFISEPDRRNILNFHNSLRNKYAKKNKVSNMMKLKWDLELEKSAQCWANSCSLGEDIGCRDDEYGRVGQNRGHTAFNEDIYKKILIDWASERTNYQFSKEFFTSAKTNRFTQMIWAETNRIGCGWVIYSGLHPSIIPLDPDTDIGFIQGIANSSASFAQMLQDDNVEKNIYTTHLVCNYGPEGNRKKELIYKTGPPSSKCPPYSKRDLKYFGLCEANEKYDRIRKKPPKKFKFDSINYTEPKIHYLHIRDWQQSPSKSHRTQFSTIGIFFILNILYILIYMQIMI